MTETQKEQLDRLNLTLFATRIAAKKHDIAQAAVTDEMRQDAMPQAHRWLAFEVEQRSSGYGHCTVSGKCPTDATVEEVEDRFYHWYFGGRDAWVKDGRFGCTIHTD